MTDSWEPSILCDRIFSPTPQQGEPLSREMEPIPQESVPSPPIRSGSRGEKKKNDPSDHSRKRCPLAYFLSSQRIWLRNVRWLMEPDASLAWKPPSDSEPASEWSCEVPQPVVPTAGGAGELSPDLKPYAEKSEVVTPSILKHVR